MPVLQGGVRVVNDSSGLWEFYVLRGDYRYEDQPDFFTSDIINDYSRALYFAGEEASRRGEGAAAAPLLERAWSMHWLFPETATLLGYISFTAGDLVAAKPLYETAAALFSEMLRLADEYVALPGLKAEIARGAAETWMHLGVLAERAGDSSEAERLYAESLRIRPLPQTHFNMAVLFWNKDWPRVERELTAALALDPGHAEAGRFLGQVRARRLQGRP
jgi:tetratricopeptide (TPR) repeat protein